jgi:hypothetical protein
MKLKTAVVGNGIVDIEPGWKLHSVVTHYETIAGNKAVLVLLRKKTWWEW